jgi:hypothetical protein
MLSILAQASNATQNPEDIQTNVFEIVTGVFSRADTLAHPDQFVPHLQSMSVVWAVVFLTCGFVCLLNGYKFYKPVTVVLAAAVGAFAGYAIGQKIHAEEYIVAACFGALLGVACMPLMKYAVALMGGLSGAFIGANAWSAIIRLAMDPGQPLPPAAERYWIGALIGLIVFGMLAFIVFKLSIVLFTSVSGSTLAVMGGMALLLQVPEWQPAVLNSLSSHAIVLPLLVMVPAIIGLILQAGHKEEVTEE